MEIEDLEAPRSFKRRNDHGRENAPYLFVYFFLIIVQKVRQMSWLNLIEYIKYELWNEVWKWGRYECWKENWKRDIPLYVNNNATITSTLHEQWSSFIFIIKCNTFNNNLCYIITLLFNLYLYYYIKCSHLNSKNIVKKN